MSRNRPAIFHVRNRPPSVAVTQQQQQQQQVEEEEEEREAEEEEEDEVSVMTPRSAAIERTETSKQRYNELKRKWPLRAHQKEDMYQLREFFYFFNLRTRKLAFKNAGVMNKTVDVMCQKQALHDLQQKAYRVWDCVHHDFLALKNAMEAAEIDLATRLAEAPKTKRPRLESTEIDPDFGCTETVVTWSDTTTRTKQSSNTSTTTSQDRHARLLRIAQETSAIREAAKILRKRARQFSQQRVMTNQEVIRRFN